MNLRLLYVVSHAFPYFSNGYAVRTHHIAKSLTDQSIEVIVLTRLGRPWDVSSFSEEVSKLESEIDGVRYLTLPQPSRENFKDFSTWSQEAAKAIAELCRIYRVDCIMAASNWQTAMPAQQAAQVADLDFFYEVRGFWELSKAARVSGHEESNEFKKHVTHESKIASNAHHVFTLTQQMRDELIRRGVASEKISLVPNGVSKLPILSNVSQEQSNNSVVTIGYIGSFSDYEGLEMLFEALITLRKRQLKAQLLLVGSSAELNSVGHCPWVEKFKNLANEAGLSDFVSVPGRVRPEFLAQYYDKIDIFVIPRLPFKVCELVSPLKPLEAASYGKALLMSDVSPLADMADEGAGITFRKGDINHLVAQLENLIKDRYLRTQLSDQALEWVKEKRQFSTIVKPMLEAFNR